METTIKQTTVNTVETAISSLATYELKVTRVNGLLKSVTASVSAQITEANGDMPIVSVQNIGTINYNEGKVSCSDFPLDEKLSMYITEFNEIVNKIKVREDLAKEGEKNNE